MVLARPDERETWPYHCSLRLFTRSSCGPIACWILARTFSLVTRSLYEMRSILRSISFPWLVFFFGALLWGSMIHKHTGRWMWQWSASSNLGAERNTVVTPIWFRPCQCCWCLCYPGEHLRLGTLISYNWAQELETFDCLKLLPFTLISVLMPLVLFVISLVFSAPISMP